MKTKKSSKGLWKSAGIKETSTRYPSSSQTKSVSHDPVFPNMNAGIQNIQNHIETSRKAFPDLKFTVDDTIAERNEVVVHWTAHGTHKGAFLGMPPTNRKVTIDGTSIYRLEGSKIAEAHANWNLATMMAQLGVIEIPREARGEAKQESSQGAKSKV
jgi:steroid delta-isomerase-like uncharacterized protein